MQDVADQNDMAQLKLLWPKLKQHADDFLAESESI